MLPTISAQPVTSKKETTYSVLANIRIQTDARLRKFEAWLDHARVLRPRNWVFYIRGAESRRAKALLKDIIKTEIFIFENLNDRDWFESTRAMLDRCDGEYILNVVEDHFFIGNPVVLDKVFSEMHSFSIDMLHYGWFSNLRFDLLPAELRTHDLSLLKYYDLDFSVNKKFIRSYYQYSGARSPWPHYISAAGAYTKRLFRNILDSEGDALCAYASDGPFNFERSAAEFCLFPLRVGLAKVELFACLDDDNIFSGSSLHSRGVYREFGERNLTRDSHPRRVQMIEIGRHRTSSSAPTKLVDQAVFANVYDWDDAMLDALKDKHDSLILFLKFLDYMKQLAGPECMFFSKIANNPLFNFYLALKLDAYSLHFFLGSRRAAHQIFEFSIMNDCYSNLDFYFGPPDLLSHFKNFSSHDHFVILYPHADCLQILEDIGRSFHLRILGFVVALFNSEGESGLFEYFLQRLLAFGPVRSEAFNSDETGISQGFILWFRNCDLKPQIST
jgi:hypothetical protein